MVPVPSAAPSSAATAPTTRIGFSGESVTAERVREQTAFDIEIADDCPITRSPTEEELALIRKTLDPEGLRKREVRT